jgi:hypothetical protein
MPLQNRVDPSGNIHAVAARGMYTGNRGVIHDPETRNLSGRRWTTRAWIICRCDFKDRKREVFGSNGRAGGAGWTNLFFLDEVTALAAGHRPCFECRRTEALAFAASFSRPAPKAADMDAILHRQRMASGGLALRLSAHDIGSLPEGAMIAADGCFLARRAGAFRAWSFHGYGEAVRPDSALLVTPPATVAALRAGYLPVWHSSA